MNHYSFLSQKQQEFGLLKPSQNDSCPFEYWQKNKQALVSYAVEMKNHDFSSPQGANCNLFRIETNTWVITMRSNFVLEIIDFNLTKKEGTA